MDKNKRFLESFWDLASRRTVSTWSLHLLKTVHYFFKNLEMTNTKKPGLKLRSVQSTASLHKLFLIALIFWFIFE